MLALTQPGAWQVAIQDVRKSNVELSPIDGDTIARLIARSAGPPGDVIRRYNALVGSQH